MQTIYRRRRLRNVKPEAPIAFSTFQTARMLKCSEYTVVERARTGDLPGMKFGEQWVFPRDALARRLTELALELSAERRAAAADHKPKPKRARKNEVPAALR